MLDSYINKKSKIFTVLLSFFISLGIFIVSARVAVAVCEEWHGLFIGVVLMLLAIPLHLLGRKRTFFYLFSLLLNFIGCGFSVSAYYLMEGLSLDLWMLIIGAIPACLVVVFIYLVLQIIPNVKKTTLTIATAANIILLAVMVIFWIQTNQVFFSFSFFCLLISLFFICVSALTVNRKKRPVLRDISYGGFGVFIIMTVIVITILTEGDALEMAGLSIDGGTSVKKKRK